MQFDPLSDADAAAVFDFLNDYWDDVESGGARPLSEYLDRYPDSQEAIAAEYLKVRSGEGSSASSDRSAGDALGGGAEHGGDDANGDGGERVGPYRVVRELGQGGQGRVVLAEDSRIERRVALKILDGYFVTEEQRQRFRREAEVIARLSHPGICSIHEADIDGAVPYIAMQFVEGEVLSLALRRARENREKGEGEQKSVFVELPWIPRSRTEVHRVLLFFERAARALHAAHEAGVVHRDIKPANIAIDGEAQPVLLDFGLAADEESQAPGLTRTGDVFGTPAYMSPEQLRGERDAIDRATDVYSLGASLFEALVGERAFQGEGRFALERAILSAPLPDARRLNRALGEDVKVVLETALERDVRRRYPTALELAEDLRRIREYEPIRARSAGPWLRLERWARRQPALAAVLVTSFVLLTGALIHARLLLGREQRANRFAFGRHLAERSSKLLAEEPAEALLVGIRAVELAPGYLTRSALYAPLEGCFLRRLLEPSTPVGRAWDLTLAPDGETLAIGLANGELALWPSRRAGDARILAEASEASALRSIDYDPRGLRLAAGSETGRLVLWGLPQGEVLASRDLASGPLLWVEFAPDGERLVVQPAEAPALVLSAADLETLSELATEPRESGCALFSPDGSLVLTASRGWQGLPLTASTSIRLWDPATGAEVRRLAGAGGAVQWAEFDARGERVVGAFDDGTVRLWETRTGRALGEPLEHEGSVLCATFSPDGSQLVTTTDHGTRSRAHLWELATLARRTLDGHDGDRVVHAAFRGDGEVVATAAFDRTVRLHDAASGELVRTLRARFRPLRVVWGHDGRSLFTLSNSSDVHVWSTGNLDHAYRLLGHEGTVSWATFTPSGERAVTASSDGSLRLWSTPARAPGPGGLEPGALLAVLRQGADPIVGAELHPGGEAVLAWDAGGRLALWDLSRPEEPLAVLEHGTPVVSAGFSPDGSRTVSVDADGRVRLWTPGATALELDVRSRWCGFGPRGELLVSVSAENAVRVLDATTGREKTRVPFEPASEAAGGAHHAAFRPDGSEIAVACADGRVRFFDPRTAAELRTPRALFQHRFVRYAPGGERLLVLGDTGGASVRVIDVEGPASEFGVQAQLSHKSRIMSATFDASGERVLTVSVDGTAYVFSAADGEVQAHYTLHDGALLFGAFSPPGQAGTPSAAGRAITASADGTAAVWPLDPYPAAVARKPRELYPWEWDREIELASPPE